ncbi:F0F1 ATP synthase subunit delta [Patescibacteria group bacterium]|nr:F0F1 ATP synthase subunit delta [Patescibacteria group bacterium]
MSLVSQILTTCLTKSAALRELSSVEDQVRARKVSREDFDKAREEIKTIEPLYLYLPAQVPEENLQSIVGKLRRDYGDRFLIEIKIDPALLGGCALSYKGIYKDYSLKAKLEKNREALKKEFDKFLI